MKKSFLLVVFIYCQSYSQNRYSEVHVAEYTPMTSSEIMNSYGSYYKAKSESEERIRYLTTSITYYDTNVSKNLNSNDWDFKQDMLEINNLLDRLKNAKSMSLDRAENILESIEEKYNRALRNYNKRKEN